MAGGVVTIVFTDLVGSTELLARLGDEQADELRRAHFAGLRVALAGHGGTEVKNIGDSLMAAFSSPASAVGCAVEMQQRTYAYARAGGVEVAIRVGVNAGEATEEEGDYFGTPVVIAKRLCDAAAGGQIIASDVVRALAGSRGGFVFKELGALPLKGIDDPVGAYEVGWEPLDEGLPLAPVIATDRTVIIGRAPERETLRRMFTFARDRSSALVLIAGEPGIGKTTLAFDLARDAQGAGAIVLYGRCEEELATPYQPVAEALAYLARHRKDVSTPFGDTRGTTDPEADRYRLFESVATTLALASSDAPVVLVLDDLHWADKPTLLLIRHLARESAEARILIVGTYRDVELDRRHPFAEALVELRRDPGYERILLRGLSIDGVVTYLERRARHALDEGGRAFAEALHRETEGNPFFIREIVRHLIESGAIYEESGRWTSDRNLEEVGLPESVREVIGRRLSRLGDDVGDVLSVASVIGRDFDLDLLARVTALGEDALADLLDAAVGARGVIEEVAGVLDRFTFAHALVRETLYEELSTSRRVRLHRRVGEALEELYAGDIEPRLAELAHHFHEAAVAGAEHRAVEYSRRAAERAVDQLAFEEAAYHVERALHTLDAVSEPDDETLCEILIAAAEIHQRMASMNQARVYGARAVEIARRHGWTDRLARAALGYGGLWIDIGLPDQGLIRSLREAALALPQEHPLVPLLEGRLAMDLFGGDTDELDAHSLRAVELARRRDDPRTLAYALVARRHAVSGPSVLEERFALTTEAIERARQTGDASLEMRARVFRIIERVEAGDAPATEAEYDEFFTLAREYRQPFYLRYMTPFLRVGIALREGRFTEVDEELISLADLAREQGRVTSIIATSSLRIQLAGFRGEPGAIDQASIDAVVRTSATLPIPELLSAWVLLTAGRHDEARTQWLRVRPEDVRNLPDFWLTLGALSSATSLAEAFGDHGVLQAAYDRLLPFAGRIVALGGTAIVWVAETVADALGKCAELAGRLDEAVGHYEDAERLNETWAMRPFLATTRIRLARTLLSRGAPDDPERARGLLDAALSAASEMGMRTSLVDQARALRADL